MLALGDYIKGKVYDAAVGRLDKNRSIPCWHWAIK